MVNYENSKIYKIICNETKKVYIGSTTKTLSARLANHVSNYKSWLKNKKSYTSSFEILKNGNYSIILLENVYCNNVEELRKKEREHIEANECVNLQIPIRNKEEYKELRGEYLKKYNQKNKEYITEKQKKYYNENKELIAEKSKLYREENKELIAENQKEYYNENKELIAEKSKLFREENREKIRVKNKDYFQQNKETICKVCICDCGSNYTKHHYLRHTQTKKHLEFLEIRKVFPNLKEKPNL